VRRESCLPLKLCGRHAAQQGLGQCFFFSFLIFSFLLSLFYFLCFLHFFLFLFS